MSIALPVYPAGTIASYSEFIAEIRDMMDNDAYNQASIDRALRKSEALFNRSLRSPDMETRIMFSIADELTELPDDFLEMRFIFQNGSPDTPLTTMSPAGLLAAYQGVAGTPAAYAIEGDFLRVGPVGAAEVEMVYYAAITPLTEAAVSNWLLNKHPDLYVSGVLYHLARRERDADAIAQAGQEVSALIDSINSATSRARWGAGPLVPAGMRQVAGARA